MTNGSGGADGLPAWLSGVEELDAAEGLRRCGSADIYLNSLKVYAETAAPNAAQIEDFRRAGDAAGVTAKVHALKSTSHAIGASALGEEAARLEAAGRAGDTRTLEAGLDGLLARCRALGERLSPLLAPAAEADDSLPPVTAEELRAAYGTIRERAEAYDLDGAAAAIEALSGRRIPEGERERFDRLRHAVDNFDWGLIGEILA